MAARRSGREAARGFDAETLRRGVRELEFSGLSVPTSDEQDYLAFYGIDFANRIPGVIHHLGHLPAAGFDIAGHFYLPPRPRGTCLIVHGYFDHVGLYGNLIEHCLRKGYAVLAWDLPGHGLSSGPQASIATFEHYIDVLGEVITRYGPQVPGPLIGIGQSTGGAVLMGWALRQQRFSTVCPFARMLLLAPLVRPADWRKVRLMHTALRPFRRSIARRFMENSGDAAFLAFLQRDPLQSLRLPVAWVSAMRRWVQDFSTATPTDHAPLVIQGDADTTVDWRWNLPQIRAKFPGSSVRMIPGARHHLVNETRELRTQIFDALGL